MLNNAPIRMRILLAILVCLSSKAWATPATEARIKAAIVYKITHFVSWPGGLNQITLCTQGSVEFSDAIKAVTEKGRQKRPIKIMAQSAGSEPHNKCNILYLSGVDSHSTKNMLNQLKNKPVLTISDEEGFAEQGGIIGLFKSDSKIRFAINLTSKDKAGLDISSQLLNLAKIIR